MLSKTLRVALATLILFPLFFPLLLNSETLIIKNNTYLSNDSIFSILDSANIDSSLIASGYFSDVNHKIINETTYIYVNEFPVIKKVNVNVPEIYPFITNKFDCFQGKILNKNILKDTLLSIVNYYNYNGYPEVIFDDIQIKDSMLTLHLYEGKIDTIEFEGTREKDIYIIKLLNIKQGDIIDNYNINSSVSKLTHSGFFYFAKYHIVKKENIYVLVFELIDRFPMEINTDTDISFRNILYNEKTKLFSITNRFDNLFYFNYHNIYIKNNFHIDKWIFNFQCDYIPFDSKIKFGFLSRFNHYNSFYGFNVSYGYKQITFGLGSEYDFILDELFGLANIKIMNEMIYLNSFILYNLNQYYFNLDFTFNWNPTDELTYNISSKYINTSSTTLLENPFMGMNYITGKNLFCIKSGFRIDFSLFMFKTNIGLVCNDFTDYQIFEELITGINNYHIGISSSFSQNSPEFHIFAGYTFKIPNLY
jgi:hypothetical protein